DRRRCSPHWTQTAMAASPRRRWRPALVGRSCSRRSESPVRLWVLRTVRLVVMAGARGPRRLELRAGGDVAGLGRATPAVAGLGRADSTEHLVHVDGRERDERFLVKRELHGCIPCCL